RGLRPKPLWVSSPEPLGPGLPLPWPRYTTRLAPWMTRSTRFQVALGVMTLTTRMPAALACFAIRAASALFALSRPEGPTTMTALGFGASARTAAHPPPRDVSVMARTTTHQRRPDAACHGRRMLDVAMT